MNIQKDWGALVSLGLTIFACSIKYYSEQKSKEKKNEATYQKPGPTKLAIAIKKQREVSKKNNATCSSKLLSFTEAKQKNKN